MHPYYTVKDLFGVAVFLIVFSAIVFFAPEMGGYFLEYNNFVPADPLKTPAHIAPVWYFTPYYAMLRAVPPVFGSQFPGVAVMGAATLIFFVLPWLDRGKVKSIRYRGTKYRAWFTAFIISFLILGYLGVEPTTVWGEFAKGLPIVGGDYIALWVARVLTRRLLPLLPADALVHRVGQGEARAAKGDLVMNKILACLLLALAPALASANTGAVAARPRPDQPARQAVAAARRRSSS